MATVTQLPSFIAEGFNRDDTTREMAALPTGKPFAAGTRFLYDGQTPEVDMVVKINLTFSRPLRDGWDRRRYTTWCLLGGRIHTIIDEQTVIARVFPSTCNTPKELECDWEATLVHEDGNSFPWVLHKFIPSV